MKKIAIFLAAVALPTAAHASIEIETGWDKHCSEPRNMAIKATNNYTYPVDIRLCMKRTEGSWRCYVTRNVKPGETAPSSWSYFVCKASGDYFWSARPAGATHLKFDDPPGYNRK